MGFKNRGYKRDTPHDLVRDYKLFVIASEGQKTEPQYFEVFQHLSKRIKVDVVGNYVKDEKLSKSHKSKSSPRWVLDRTMAYITKNGLTDEDDLWFVIDKDR